MAFELHVWSPAWDLPSIDPQCLAAIGYLSCISESVDADFQWQIVASNDLTICATSSVNNIASPIYGYSTNVNQTEELPALKDPISGTTIGGLQNIIDYLRTRDPSWDLDQTLTDDPVNAADQIAFTAHISTQGNILLSLSLFASTENYTTVTRPTYSSFLRWPTQYIIPPNLRSRARNLTAHLGLASPDLDANEDPENRSKSIIPESLRTFGNSGGSGHSKSLTETLAHQHTSTQFRLEALVDDFCDPLSCLLRSHQEHGTQSSYFLSTSPASIDTLATAYLSLMLNPSLPQNWLQTRIRTRWPDLAEYSQRAASHLWGSKSRNFAPIDTYTKSSGPRLTWKLPPQQNALSSTLTALTANLLPPRTTIIEATTPSFSTTAMTPDGNRSDPTSPREQPKAHSFSTVLLAATAFTTTLAAVSTYLLVPYLSSDTEETKARRKPLNEMGEAGSLLSSIVEIDPVQGGMDDR